MNKLNFEKIKILFKILIFNSLKILNLNYFFITIFNKLKKNKPINFKFGIDPTNKYLHLGHLYYFFKIILLNKLNFIKIIIIIGFITSFLKNFNKNLILNNILYFIYNIKYIIKNINNKIKLYYNNEWVKILNIYEKDYLISNSKIFKYKNLNKYKKISFLYLIYQSYDSIFTKTEIEIGGIDQYLIFIFCYDFLFKFIKKNQIYLTFPLLLNKKMLKLSKSYKDNFFNIKNIIKNLKNSNFKNFINYFKLLIFKNLNFLNFLKKNLIFKNITILLIKKFFLKYFKKIFLKKDIIKFLKFKIESIVFFKIKKIFFRNSILIKNKNFFINKLKIFNKNLILFKGNYLVLNFFYFKLNN